MAKNPLERVAQELAEQLSGKMTETEITDVLKRILMRYQTMAYEANESDDHLDGLEKSQEFWICAELINQFGTALIAYDDMEEYDMSPVPKGEPN